MIYIAVLCSSTESLQNRSTILPLFIGSYAAATVRRFSTKALARYQVILLEYPFRDIAAYWLKIATPRAHCIWRPRWE